MKKTPNSAPVAESQPSPTAPVLVSRTLFEIMIQPSFIDRDSVDNLTRVNSKPVVIAAGDLQDYIAGLLEYSEKAKQGVIPTSP